MEWTAKPGDDWDKSPIFDEEFGSWFVLGTPSAASYVKLPKGIPGYAAGTVLYIETLFVISFTCPFCGDEREKRGLAFKQSTLVMLECVGCQRFLWCEIERR